MPDFPGLRTAMRPQPQRWNYRCPACGAEAHETDLTVQVDTDIHEKIEYEEAWPGGPALPIHDKPREYAPGERWFSTNVCGDRFSSREWTLHVTTREGDPVGSLELARSCSDGV